MSRSTMNIHQQRTLQWMTGVMALMIGAWLLLNSQSPTVDRAYIFPEIENADIARIHITNGEDNVAVFRTEQGWQRMGHGEVEVDYALLEPKLKNLLEASWSPALESTNAAQYGLEPPQMTITVVDNEGAEHLLRIGNALQVSTDTYISRGTSIHTTSGNLLLEWRATIDTIVSTPNANTSEEVDPSPVATP